MSVTCDITLDTGLSSPLDEDDIVRVVEAVLASEGVSRPCMVSVSLVDDDRIRQINAQWRGVDEVTDVVSIECERPDDPDLFAGEPCELGDIVLAPCFIARQAKGFGTSWADEFRLLLVHGILHLLGYDHLDEDEATAMEAKEMEILGSLALDAPMDHVILTRHRKEADET